MGPDPTVAISWDYLVELTDDGKQPDGQEPEVILLPPVPPTAEVEPMPTDRSDKGPQS
jgi:hypothetical protein